MEHSKRDLLLLRIAAGLSFLGWLWLVRLHHATNVAEWSEIFNAWFVLLIIAFTWRTWPKK